MEWIDLKDHRPSFGDFVLFWDTRYNEPEVRLITDDFEEETTYTHWVHINRPKQVRATPVAASANPEGGK